MRIIAVWLRGTLFNTAKVRQPFTFTRVKLVVLIVALPNLQISCLNSITNPVSRVVDGLDPFCRCLCRSIDEMSFTHFVNGVERNLHNFSTALELSMKVQGTVMMRTPARFCL